MAAFPACSVSSKNTVPHELTSARLAYERVEEGPAAIVNAARLREAKDALDAAERAYRERPGSATTRDLAYLAERRAQLVDAETGIILADRRKAVAERLRSKGDAPKDDREEADR